MYVATFYSTHVAADRRNMEPPDEVQCNISIICYTNLCVSNLRIRGGGNDDEKRYVDIPELSQMRFMWDGLPCIDFHEKIIQWPCSSTQ